MNNLFIIVLIVVIKKESYPSRFDKVVYQRE